MIPETVYRAALMSAQDPHTHLDLSKTSGPQSLGARRPRTCRPCLARSVIQRYEREQAD